MWFMGLLQEERSDPCFSTGKYVSRTQNSHTMEYYSAIKSDQVIGTCQNRNEPQSSQLRLKEDRRDGGVVAWLPSYWNSIKDNQRRLPRDGDGSR